MGAAPENVRDRSLPELVERLSQDVRELVRAEVALARAEIVDSARRLSVAAGLVTAAAVCAIAVFAVLVAAAILGLATAIPAWLAALIVALLTGFGVEAKGVRLAAGRSETQYEPAE